MISISSSLQSDICLALKHSYMEEIEIAAWVSALELYSRKLRNRKLAKIFFDIR